MASDAARGVVDFGGEAFGAVWTRVIHPVIKDEYEELLNTVPLRMRVKQDNRFERKGKKEDKEDADIIQRK